MVPQNQAQHLTFHVAGEEYAVGIEKVLGRHDLLQAPDLNASQCEAPKQLEATNGGGEVAAR